MTEKKTYICDLCKKTITKGHQELYMATIEINGYSYNGDDGSEHWSDVYHVHNDRSNHCLSKIGYLLSNEEKKYSLEQRHHRDSKEKNARLRFKQRRIKI